MHLNKRFSRSMLLLVFVLSPIFSPVFAQTPDSWVQKTDAGGTMISGPCARSDAFSFTLNGKGYIGGGDDGFTTLNDFWEYDPVTNSWTQKADYPGGPTRAVGFAIGNKGFAGTGGVSVGSKDFYAYDPVLNSWTKKANFVDLRYAAYGFSIGAKGYIGGGLDNNGTWKSDLWEYDTSADSWSAKASLPHVLALAGAFSIGGKGYIVCGDSVGKTSAKVWCYDPVTNSLAAKASFPGPARNPGAGLAVGNTGFIYSGTGGNADLWQYYPATDSWVQRANLPGNVSRIKAAPFAIGAKGYFVGGQGAATVSNDCFVFDTASKVWSKVAPISSSRREGAVGFSIGGNGYMGTGVVGTSRYQHDFWMYDTLRGTWTQKADFAGAARAFAAGFAIANKGYIGTGSDGYRSSLDDFWEYDPALNKWTKKSDYPAGSCQSAAGFSIGGKGYLGNGFSAGVAFDDWYEYDPKTDAWTAKAKCPSGPTERTTGFTIGKRGYLVSGTFSGNFISRAFWEYNPDSNSWKQKADPLFYEWGTTGFSLGGRGYLIGGYANLIASDRCTEYDPDSNVWRNLGSFSGGTRNEAFAFSIGNKAYVGTGRTWLSKFESHMCNDFWQYTPAGILTAVNGVGLCQNDSMPVVVPYSSSEQFAAGNTFKAQLSDSSGSFVNPVLLNALPGSSTGIMLIRLPLPHNNYFGHNYRLRIVSDSPAITGSSADLVVFLSPKPLISWNSGVLSTAGNYKTYQWLLDDTAISAANLATWMPTINGVYKLLAIDGNGCQSISDSIVVSGLNAHSYSLLPDVQCYPNPVVDELHISGKGTYDVSLIRLDGSICLHSVNIRRLNMKSLAAGVYILKINEPATGRVAFFRILKVN